MNMLASQFGHCPHCGASQREVSRFCDSCGWAMPTNWDGARVFDGEERANIGVSYELREAVLGRAVRSGCARWYFGVGAVFGVIGAGVMSYAYGLPEVQEAVSYQVLALIWAEVFLTVGLFVWSRTHPYAASITAFVGVLTMAAVTMAVFLPALDGPFGGAVIGMGVRYLVYLVVVGMVVKASRNPLAPSKLSSKLALNPQPLRVQGPPASESVARPGTAHDMPMLPTEERASAAGPDGRSLQEVIEARPAEVLRLGVQAGQQWMHPLPLRIFQLVIVTLILFQLHRISMLFFGSSGRFFPYTHLPTTGFPWIGLADTVVALVAATILVKGLLDLAGSSEFNLGYWLRVLPWLAAGWGALAVARGLFAAYLDATNPVSFSYLSSGYVYLLFADLVKAALCLVVRKAWDTGPSGD